MKNDKFPYAAGQDDEFWDVYNERPDPQDYLRTVGFMDGLGRLSREARQVVNLIFTSPGELADWTIEQADVTKGTIRMYMESCGWPRRRINRAFREIRAMLIGI